MQSIRHKQFALFLGLVVTSLAIAAGPGRHLLSFAYNTGDQSYILLVPVLSAMLVYRDQDAIFSSVHPGTTRSSITGLAVGFVLILLGYALRAGTELQLAVTALGLVTFWVGAFMLCFGTKSARAATFPLAMLLWVVPIPAFCIDAITRFLQVGSTELVAMLFSATGVPVLRDGFVFHLSSQSIEVAKECSGIRSSLSLIILTLIVAHESLHGNVRRATLLVSTIPIVILKNGVRIVTLTLLAVYVDSSFLTGRLHHQGGIVFFILGLLMLVPVLMLLRRGETRKGPAESVTARGKAVAAR
jgi:exosortase